MLQRTFWGVGAIGVVGILFGCLDTTTQTSGQQSVGAVSRSGHEDRWDRRIGRAPLLYPHDLARPGRVAAGRLDLRC